MKEFKGTKGELKIFEEFRYVSILNESNQIMFSSNINCFDNEDGLHKYYSHNKIMANAKLMVASKDLLEALKRMVEWFGKYEDHECEMIGKQILCKPEDQPEIIQMSMKVINKALN